MSITIFNGSQLCARNLLLTVAPEAAVGPDRMAGERGLQIRHPLREAQRTGAPVFAHAVEVRPFDVAHAAVLGIDLL